MSDYKYTGIHIGIVKWIDTKNGGVFEDDSAESYDFQNVKVYVPGVDEFGGSTSDLPTVQVTAYSIAGAGWGQFSPVQVNDKVLVMFLGASFAIRAIVGRFHPGFQIPQVFRAIYPYGEGYVSRNGHSLIFNNGSVSSGVSLLSKRGIGLRVRDAWDEVKCTTESGASILIRGSDSSDDDPDTANKGVIVESVPDNEGKKFTIQVDDENGEAVVTSREGYTVTIRDTDQVGSSEKKGITIRTTADRSITIDEQTGKLYIKHDGEVIVEGSKTIIDSDLEVNGKVSVTGDIEGDGKVVASGNVESTLGMIHDVLGNLTMHNHAVAVPPGNSTIPPRA